MRIRALVSIGLLAPALALASPVAYRLQLAPTGEAPGDQFGVIVGGPGDLNGDGYDDLVVDGFLNDARGGDAGRAYVFFGGPALDASPDLILTGEGPGDNFGVAKGAGDVNGDGYADLIVGANQAGTYPLNPGKAYLFLGGAAMDGTPDAIFTGESPGDLFGSRAVGAGDVNGDGYDDLVVGAIGSAERAGSAYLFLGGPLVDSVPDLVLHGEGASDEFGLVGRAGDVNGDGYGDLIIGAWLAKPGGWWEVGRAYLYYGAAAMDTVPDRVFTGQAVGDRFGVAVMGTGDVNGDAYADVIVGAYWNDAGGNDAGRAYIYYGAPDMDVEPDVTLTGAAADDGFGKSVCDAGDVDADGYADVIVGAYTCDGGGTDSGRGYLFCGGPAMDATPEMVFTGEGPGDQLGYWVSSAGDVNRDGFPDVILGASFNDAGGQDAGRAYLLDFNRYVVESPNGGESWRVGGAGIVSWRGAEPADIWLSLDDGLHYDRVMSGAGGHESNTVSIAVPDHRAARARVRVTPTNATVAGHDQSDSPFRVLMPGDRLAAALAAPWPNPARGQVQLALELPEAASCAVSLEDLSGRRVATVLGAQPLPAGRKSWGWSPGALPAGIYALRARVDGRDLMRLLVWLGADGATTPR